MYSNLYIFKGIFELIVEKNRVKMTVTESTKDLVMNACKEEFLKHHPEMDGMFISQDFMIIKIAKFYLENDY